MELRINDSNAGWYMVPPAGYAKGLIPRDYQSFPRGCYATLDAVDFPLIPRSEWSDRIKAKVAAKSQLSDLMLARQVPTLDQNGKGYCWAHSSTGAVMAARAVMGEPTVELSAYAVACIIKSYQDEGGWGALSADWIAANGVPSSQFWPQRSMSRSNDTPAMRANAALHKITGQWADLQAAEYDRDLSFDQVGTLLLSNVPVVCDFNWWSHSVLGCDLVETSPGQFGIRIRNSWGDSWGTHGFGVLEGQKAIPDGAVGLRSTLPSPA